MTGNRPDIEAIFFAAQQAPPHERAAYLDKVCGTDTDLRARIEQFLNAQADIGSFLEVPIPDLAASTDTAITERPGTLIGPYKLLEQIGEGGFGVVFMAEQQHPVRRKVALKVIKPGMDTRQVIARFEAERQALALMEHPNIAKVLDAGATDSGRPYFVMELVKGLPITDYCDQNRLTARQRLELFIPVCQAAQHAHQKGIIHRDLKPANVLVTLHDGTPVVKVIDFGIAKAIGEKLTEITLFTNFAQMIGTPLYMSPEQAALSDMDVDTRSDIYSLGVLLYELLTGSTPFDKARLLKAGYDEIRRIIREEEPPRPSTRISTLGATATSISERRRSDPRQLSRLFQGELDWIVMKALEKDRNRRYETAGAFVADVLRQLRDEAVEARPASASYRLRKTFKKHRILLVTGTAFLVLLTTAAVLGTLLAAWATIAEADADKALKESEKLRQVAVREHNAVYQNLYYADMRLGLPDWNSGNLERLAKKLRDHVPEPGKEDVRGWEWYYLLALSHQEEQTLLLDNLGAAFDVSWSPDGNYLAAVEMGKVKVWDTRTWDVLRTFQAHHSTIAWSPDSQWLALAPSWPNPLLHVWHMGTGKVHTLLGHTDSIRSVAWSRDGKHIASAGVDRTIRIWDTATRACVRVVEGVQGDINVLYWHPEGKMLASAGYGAALLVWNVGSGEKLRTITPGVGRLAVAWSPNGKTLAYNAFNSIVLCSTTDWSEAARWQSGLGNIRSLAWAPDGSRLAAAGDDRLIQLWDPTNPIGETTMRGHLGGINSIGWDPNGRRLASAADDGQVRVWQVESASQPRRLEIARGEPVRIAWADPPNSLRSYHPFKGLATHWNVAAGQETGHSEVPRGRGWLSPSGRLLAVVAAGEKNYQLSICEAGSGAIIRTVTGQAALTEVDWQLQLIFSPDDSRLAILRPSSIEVLDLAEDKVCFHFESIPGPRAGAWSADGHFLAVAGTGAVNVDRGPWAFWSHVFDIDNRQRVSRYQLASRSTFEGSTVCWKGDGSALMSGDTTGIAVISEPASGRERLCANIHTGKIRASAWSPDGRRIASASQDRTVRVWDPANGEELLRFDVAPREITQLLWSKNGRQLVGACSDGSILIWDAGRGYDYVVSDAWVKESIRASRLRVRDLWRLEYMEEAVNICRQALARSKAAFGPDHPETIQILFELAGTLYRAGKVASADELFNSPAQVLDAALFCDRAGLHLAGLHFFQMAFEAVPRQADDLDRANRYNAACAAEGAARGDDAAISLGQSERVRLRNLALQWLRADLAAWRAHLDQGTENARLKVRFKMEHWQSDLDFNSVRGQAALARLPEAERIPWERLWEEVEGLKNLAQELPAAKQP